MDLLTGQYFNNYTPTENITTDEAIIPYKGRFQVVRERQTY